MENTNLILLGLGILNLATLLFIIINNKKSEKTKINLINATCVLIRKDTKNFLELMKEELNEIKKLNEANKEKLIIGIKTNQDVITQELFENKSELINNHKVTLETINNQIVQEIGFTEKNIKEKLKEISKKVDSLNQLEELE